MRVGVVGAGITGLSLTHFLAERDVDVVTFEAASEPGGVIRSRRIDGRVLEYGPQRARLSPAVEGLVADLELTDELVVADESVPLYVYADGRLRTVPRSVTDFLRTDLLSWRGKLRVLAEPLTGAADPDESAADAFERKFGREAYRNLIEPLFGGTYGSDPATMPAEYALEPLLALEDRHGSLLQAAIARFRGRGDVPPPITFAGGLQTLPATLYEAHRPYVHLDLPVDAVRNGSDGGGYVVETGRASTDVDVVVVTVPAPAAASILADVDGVQPEPLSALTYNSLALVHLHADVSVEGFGYQVRRDEALRTLGVTWNDGLFDRDGVFTAFLGGMDDPAILDLPPEDVGAIASREFEAVMGVEPSTLDVTTLPDVLPAYDASWHALEDLALLDDVVLATNYTDRLGIGARVRQAREVADDLADRSPSA